MKSSPSSAGSPNRAAGPPLPLVAETRVRYAETDQMGVAHHRHHFVWFEVGRTEFARRYGFPYVEIEDRGLRLVVVEAACRYRRPLRYDDVVLIHVGLGEVSARKVVFEYRLIRQADGELVATGRTVHIVTDPQGRASSLPEDVLLRIRAAAART
jgi:acyl-CoA thioester hydrolase